MPEFLQLLPPDAARALLLANLPLRTPSIEEIDSRASLGRVTAIAIVAPESLPEFPRSTVDGYAVRSRDTFGASDSQPAYFTLLGEVPMGAAAGISVGAGECALIHTGGMLPHGADAVVMLEYTQVVPRAGAADVARADIELMRAAALGENTISVGEDVAAGSVVIPAGRRLRPAEIGGLMALGITRVAVAMRPRIGLISSGDEVVEPAERPGPGQVRDVNAYTLEALVEKYGGQPVHYGIVRDDKLLLKETAGKALTECEAVIITAGIQ
jgi:molybdopterin molybdotransferase